MPISNEVPVAGGDGGWSGAIIRALRTESFMEGYLGVGSAMRAFAEIANKNDPLPYVIVIDPSSDNPTAQSDRAYMTEPEIVVQVWAIGRNTARHLGICVDACLQRQKSMVVEGQICYLILKGSTLKKDPMRSQINASVYCYEWRYTSGLLRLIETKG